MEQITGCAECKKSAVEQGFILDFSLYFPPPGFTGSAVCFYYTNAGACFQNILWETELSTPKTPGDCVLEKGKFSTFVSLSSKLSGLCCVSLPLVPGRLLGRL